MTPDSLQDPPHCLFPFCPPLGKLTRRSSCCCFWCWREAQATVKGLLTPNPLPDHDKTLRQSPLSALVGWFQTCLGTSLLCPESLIMWVQSCFTPFWCICDVCFKLGTKFWARGLSEVTQQRLLSHQPQPPGWLCNCFVCATARKPSFVKLRGCQW